jgi:Cu2+-exporting ATPase
MRPSAASAVASDDDTCCFHCGDQLSPATRRQACVAGAWRSFCCPGCEAVAQAIVGQGLADYYRVRESLPAKPDTMAGTPTGAAAVDLAVYDDVAVQSAFVTTAANGEREAALLLEGIRCSACVWLNEETLRRVPGVTAAEINYATHRARVRWNPERVQLSRILAAISGIGYRAYPFDPKRLESVRGTERSDALWRLFVAGFGMMQVMMYAVPVYLAEEGTMSADIEGLMRWASLVLTLPVVLYSAQPFFRGALRDFRLRRLGMDVPVALGVAVAFGASVWATLTRSGEVYFDSVAMFVFLLLLGRYLELRARQEAASAIQYLAKLQPDLAERFTDFPTSRQTETVPAAKLRRGEMILVKPGAVVPADGVVTEGRGEVAEAVITGESRAVPKPPGASVIGGSVNVGGPLVVRVECVGPDSVLAGIVKMVERAVGEKQRIAELADRYAHWFVVAILAIAALSAAAWLVLDPPRALWIAVAVLVVTCPCALSLATPVALTAATGELARNGFVVTRGHAIEALANATDVVFDKTGTLTQGEMRVVSVEPFGPLGPDECLALAAALEQGSEHPIARAVLSAARERRLVLPAAAALDSHAGLGVVGRIDGSDCAVGRRSFVLRSKDESDVDGGVAHTVVWVARDGALLARVVIGDVLRPEAARAVARIRATGRGVHLLSGDTVGPVSHVAGVLGLDSWRAGASPGDKCDHVARLQAEGRRVCMVGDGVNDAPVLAKAAVSIAMAEGAHLAQVHADAILLSGRLDRLADALELSTRTLRVIRQNLAWAFAYNLVAVPLAVAGLVTPWLAGLGMSASSLAVVLNALRLRRTTTVRGAPEQRPAVEGAAV